MEAYHMLAYAIYDYISFLEKDIEKYSGKINMSYSVKTKILLGRWLRGNIPIDFDACEWHELCQHGMIWNKSNKYLYEMYRNLNRKNLGWARYYYHKFREM